MRIRPVVRSLVGIVNEKLPDVTDCVPNVKAATALSDAFVSLYNNAQSNDPDDVRFDQVTEALGVQNATIPVPPELLGALPFVTALPPAV